MAKLSSLPVLEVEHAVVAQAKVSAVLFMADHAALHAGVVKTGDNLADGATDALAGGPRPLVKGAVVVIGGLLLWSLVKKVRASGCSAL